VVVVVVVLVLDDSVVLVGGVVVLAGAGAPCRETLQPVARSSRRAAGQRRREIRME
jgi:hypothetical protein